MGLLLHGRGAPAGHAAGDVGGGALGPGISGSAVAASTTPVDKSGLDLDNNPDLSTPQFPTATAPSDPDVDQTHSSLLTASVPSSSSTHLPSNTAKSSTTTIIIASVAAAAFLLIASATLLLFCRSNKSRRRQSGRGNWREIGSQHSHNPHASFAATGPRVQSEGMFESKSVYSTRRSMDAAPSINMHFPQEPFMSSGPFANGDHNSRGQPPPPVPTMPALQHVQQPQQILVQHPYDPPSAGFSAPSEYTASYIRSVYSATTGDQHSIADSQHTASSTPRSRSNTLKRAPDRAKNNQELIALDNLIAALDFGDGQNQQHGLPDPALFRAALGGAPGHGAVGH